MRELIALSFYLDPRVHQDFDQRSRITFAVDTYVEASAW